MFYILIYTHKNFYTVIYKSESKDKTTIKLKMQNKYCHHSMFG